TQPSIPSHVQLDGREYFSVRALFLTPSQPKPAPNPRSALRPKQIANGLPPADHAYRSAVHQHLSRPWPRVVVRRQRHSVRSRVKDCQHVALVGHRQFAIPSKKVSALTNGADHIDSFT